ncbi:MAG: hypothetical protein P4L45_12425 [Ignavibacteriaceae bacterium]|nr:hypothetical protein [Ignavibacteriaceae bacterium]
MPSTFNYSYGKKIILVSKKDTVKTLAGVFYNCINFRQEQFCGDSGICNTWFAKGVGKIKFITKENNEIKENRLDNYYIDTLAKYDYFKYREFKLIQKYPTPFCPTTDIKYSLKSSSYVTLKIYE